MQPWLAHALCAFRVGPTHTGQAAVVSIGNDGGDLDSLCSSMALAVWRPIGEDDGIEPLWVPVAPFDRCDFKLRQDACLLFGHVNLPFDDDGAPAELLHLDDLDCELTAKWQGAGGLGVALVDHNACGAGVGKVLGERVVAIVDHHSDEKRHLVPSSSDAAVEAAGDDALAALVTAAPPLRVVDPAVGSTCSLLAELMDAPGGALASYPTILVPMLSAIAVDTRGFSPPLLNEKFVALDVRAAQHILLALGATVPRILPPTGRPGSEGFELVLESILALRQVELPPSAQVGNAKTLPELSDALLAARYDVAALTTVELMRWDYKEVVRAGGLTLGVAAICEVVDDLFKRSGGPAELQADMIEASERRGAGGLGLLVGLTKEDAAAGGLKGLVALLPPADDARAPPAAALLEAIDGIPTLPPALASNALFRAQSIEDEGFGISWQPVEGAPRLRISTLREQATRKTLMPALLRL